MRGPDFEIHPIEPPAPPVEDPVTTGQKGPSRSPLRAAARVAMLALSGVVASAWYSSQATSSTPTTVVPRASTTERPGPSTSSTAPTTAARTATFTRTCAESSQSPDAAGGAVPEGFPWITFHVGPRAASDALARIARDAAQARTALGDAGAFGVRVYCEVQEMADALRMPADEVQKDVTAGQVAFMRSGDMWIYGPTFEQQPASTQRQIVYHEYFHALQRSLSRSRSVGGSGTALWLLEGSARYFEHALTPEELENFRRSAIRRRDDLPALEDLERSGEARSEGGTGHAYTVGAVAVDYLVSTYGRERILSDFWLALAPPGTGWRSAFLQVFGVSVDTFYADFAAYRQTLRP